VKSQKDPLDQLQNTSLSVSQLFSQILTDLQGFKFVETLKVTFTKRKDDRTIYKLAYFNNKVQIVINPNDCIPSLHLSQHQILNGTAVWLSEGSGWVINSVNTVKYDPLKGSS